MWQNKMDGINSEMKTKIYVSECLSEIPDKSLQNILREIIFSNNIDYDKAQKTIIKHRPEMKKHFEE